MPGEIIGEGLAALLRSRRAGDGHACVLVGLVFWAAAGFSVGWWLRRSTG